MVTLAERLRPTNGLNVIRLLLAVLVIVSHAPVISGLGQEPSLNGLTLGAIAVGGFFAISGYLISKSRLFQSAGKYAWNRVLRLFPAYWACLAFTGIVAAGIAGLWRGGWTAPEGIHFVLRNFFMISPGGDSVGSTLVGLPIPNAWNGSLWTLRYEVLCYIIVGLIFSVPAFRRSKGATPAFFIVSTAASVIIHFRGDAGIAGKLALLVPFFAAGGVLMTFAHRIPSSRRLAGLSALLFVAICLAGFGRSLAALPLAYFVIWLAGVLPKPIRDIGSTRDVSYGVYLYAFPLQQLLVIFGAPALGLTVFVGLGIAATVPLAFASYYFVEKPALRLKSFSLKSLAVKSLRPKLFSFKSSRRKIRRRL